MKHVRRIETPPKMRRGRSPHNQFSCVRRFVSAAGSLLELSCKTFHVKHAIPRLAPRLLMLGWLGATAVSAAMRPFGWGGHVSATIHEKLRSLAITTNTPPRTGRA